jgi:aspartyl-tRNA(Asn)/glutamyl-tRNA(Gln) amidotransferase subunit C
MITNETIAHLAHLARIKVTDQEKESLKQDLEKILAYVEEVGQVETDTIRSSATQAVQPNIVRNDVVTASAGQYTQDLVDAAPKHKDNYITVKKIISQD